MIPPDQSEHGFISLPNEWLQNWKEGANGMITRIMTEVYKVMKIVVMTKFYILRYAVQSVQI